MEKPEVTNILLVDDRPERLLALRTILAPLNQNLVPASSGEIALWELLRRDFSVILLDVHMPGMNGFETARLIRTRPKFSHTPIIFVTGSREWDDIERAYTLGAVDFITVPIVPHVLRAKVAVFVDLYQTAELAEKEAAARIHEEHARKEAEAANAAKDEFLAMVSHELRTPLPPLLAAIEMLQDEHDPESLRQTLHMMRRNLEMEARLIGDLLDVSRIETGKLHMEMETVNVENALTRAVEICKHNAEEKSVHLDYSPRASEQFAEGDAARLQQVFWNLIHNAIKFTPAGGSVSVRSLNPSPEEIRVDVVDTGLGIDPHHVNRVFKRGMQVSQSPASHGRKSGLGLGLAISKSLVESHNGKIWATSLGIGRGATFSVVLRTSAKRPQPPVKSGVQPPAAGGESLRILLVDDHKDTRDALQRLLIRKGYHIEVAQDVASGLETGCSGKFDLLISDIGLPDGTGIDLMLRLKETCPLPGIALSGFGMEQDIKRSKEAGFIEHLTKPVSFSQLQTVIARIHRELRPEG
jgi:signal transduction histidine kinase